MDLAAIFMLLTLVIMMVIGMPITWSLGGAIIMALMIDQDLSLALITQKCSQDAITSQCLLCRPSS